MRILFPTQQNYLRREIVHKAHIHTGQVLYSAHVSIRQNIAAATPPRIGTLVATLAQTISGIFL